MKISITEVDLKAAISSTVRRQNLLAAYPGVMSLLPLTALAIGDAVAENMDRNLVEEYLCGPDTNRFQLPGPPKVLVDHRYPVMGTTIIDSCRTCSRIYPHSVFSPKVHCRGMLDMRWSGFELLSGTARRFSLAEPT